MIKTLITLSGAALLFAVAPLAQAQHGGPDFRSSGAMRPSAGAHHPQYAARSADRYGHGHGHYYYYGGVPYFFPFDYGLGYDGFGYGPYGYGYGYAGPNGGPAAYEGRIADYGHGNQDPSALPSAVQKQLLNRGYYKGKVDGEFGPASRSALSKFQRDNDLRDTGRIDEASLKALGFSDHD